jgi:hypothetical protein
MKQNPTTTQEFDPFHSQCKRACQNTMLQNRPTKHPFQACTAGHVAVKIRIHTSRFEEKKKPTKKKKRVNPHKLTNEAFCGESSIH